MLVVLPTATNSDAPTPVIVGPVERAAGICRNGYFLVPSEDKNWQEIYNGDYAPLFKVDNGDIDDENDCDRRCSNFC